MKIFIGINIYATVAFACAVYLKTSWCNEIPGILYVVAGMMWPILIPYWLLVAVVGTLGKIVEEIANQISEGEKEKKP